MAAVAALGKDGMVVIREYSRFTFYLPASPQVMWAARAEPGPVISLRESHFLLGALSQSKSLLQQ